MTADVTDSDSGVVESKVFVVYAVVDNDAGMSVQGASTSTGRSGPLAVKRVGRRQA